MLEMPRWIHLRRWKACRGEVSDRDIFGFRQYWLRILPIRIWYVLALNFFEVIPQDVRAELPCSAPRERMLSGMHLLVSFVPPAPIALVNEAFQ